MIVCQVWGHLYTTRLFFDVVIVCVRVVAENIVCENSYFVDETCVPSCTCESGADALTTVKAPGVIEVYAQVCCFFVVVVYCVVATRCGC